MEKEEVKISVRDIVEFILRSGDIDNRRGGWADKESLAKVETDGSSLPGGSAAQLPLLL